MPAELIALPTTPRQIDSVRARCRKLVGRNALMSAGAVLVPLPGLDFAADVTLLSNLIPRINYEFGLTPEQIEKLNPDRRALVYKAVVAFGGAMIGKLVTRELIFEALKLVGARVTAKQAAKYVPIAGQALAAGLSWGAMSYVGRAHIEDCVRVVTAVAQAPNR